MAGLRDLAEVEQPSASRPASASRGVRSAGVLPLRDRMAGEHFWPGNRVRRMLVRSMRTFTLDEAQSLLPVLEALLRRAIESKQAAEQVEARLSSLAQRIYLAGGMRVDVAEIARQRGEIETHTQRARETVSEIVAIGVQVKDLDTGLLDFPFRLDDEVVLLCWRMGETSIEHWHRVEDGFQGRQPVDERFRRRSGPASWSN